MKVPLPGKTPGEDTVQYVVREDGKLAEIALSGPLSCPADVYRRFAGWDFTSKFPTLAGQDNGSGTSLMVEARSPHLTHGAENGAQ